MKAISVRTGAAHWTASPRMMRRGRAMVSSSPSQSPQRGPDEREWYVGQIYFELLCCPLRTECTKPSWDKVTKWAWTFEDCQEQLLQHLRRSSLHDFKNKHRDHSPEHFVDAAVIEERQVTQGDIDQWKEWEESQEKKTRERRRSRTPRGPSRTAPAGSRGIPAALRTRTHVAAARELLKKIRGGQKQHSEWTEALGEKLEIIEREY